MKLNKLLLSTGALGVGIAAIALRLRSGQALRQQAVRPADPSSTVQSTTDLDTIRSIYRIWAPVYEWGTGPLLLGQEGRLRRKAVARLGLRPGDTVLDVACGTGRNFSLLQDAVGPIGRIVGFDYTPEMLAVAEERVARQAWDNVTLIQGDAAELTLDEPFAQAQACTERSRSDRPVDAVLCTLGMTVIPHWREAIRRAVAVLKPGGALVIADVRVSDQPGMRPVNAVIDWLSRVLAAADVRRRPWEFMATVLDDVELENFFFDLGFVAWGRKLYREGEIDGHIGS
ncbi:MAG: class I SAM-dependent methyltransferase [Anaerolineae bacterium]